MTGTPEKLERGMHSDPSRMSNGPERPVVEQDNDVDAPFTTGESGAIPKHLQNLIQMCSVDEEPVEVEQVENEARVDVDKLHEENPNTRFRILNAAIKKPGVCALCTSPGGDGRQFVDFGKTMEWYGVVYFCTFCVTEAAKLMGFAPLSTWELARTNLQEEISKLDDLYVETKVKLNAANLLLRDHLSDNCCTHVSDDEISEAIVVSDEIESGTSDAEPESANGDEQNPDKPVVGKGPNDVSGSSSNDEPKPRSRSRRSAQSDG